tara:strand:+ start:151 stop:780 length:630 start_codon:yes stop_codon:yes gene_type:complete
MPDINSLKFKIVPEETMEVEEFVNSENKEKEKKIWIAVYWNYYERREFNINDFNIFNDCKTLEDIQSKLDEKIKEATPVVKDTSHFLQKGFSQEHDSNIYATSELSQILGAKEDDVFLNESSGGGAWSEIFQSENVDDNDWDKTVSESVKGETDVSLRTAADGWQDDVLESDFNYSPFGPDTFYRLPLKVIEVKKDEKKKKIIKLSQTK